MQASRPAGWPVEKAPVRYWAGSLCSTVWRRSAWRLALSLWLRLGLDQPGQECGEQERNSRSARASRAGNTRRLLRDSAARARWLAGNLVVGVLALARLLRSLARSRFGAAATLLPICGRDATGSISGAVALAASQPALAVLLAMLALPMLLLLPMLPPMLLLAGSLGSAERANSQRNSRTRTGTLGKSRRELCESRSLPACPAGAHKLDQLGLQRLTRPNSSSLKFSLRWAPRATRLSRCSGLVWSGLLAQRPGRAGPTQRRAAESAQGGTKAPGGRAAVARSLARCLSVSLSLARPLALRAESEREQSGRDSSSLLEKRRSLARLIAR